MSIQQEMRALRDALSKEQELFESVGITDAEVEEINLRCGKIKRDIRRLETHIHKPK